MLDSTSKANLPILVVKNGVVGTEEHVAKDPKRASGRGDATGSANVRENEVLETHEPRQALAGHLEDVLVGSEGEFLAIEDERDVRKRGEGTAVHSRLASWECLRTDLIVDALDLLWKRSDVVSTQNPSGPQGGMCLYRR